MRRTLLVLALVMLSGALFAQTELEKTFTQKTSQAGLPEFFSNWRVLSIIAIMTSVILVAIAYAIGRGMEMPEIQAWASTELVQVFVNVIIIIALLAVIALIDVTVQGMVISSGLNIGCSGGQTCLGNVTVAYLQTYIDTASSDARKVVIDNINDAGWTNRRFGIYCTSILCANAGVSFSVLGYWLLDQDRTSIVFEYYTNIISSMEAQKFFVENISFNIGPLILGLGILARSFFFTRKLGGLLIAVAAGIMFFLPSMYVFDWVTLDTTLTGDKNVGDLSASACPVECTLQDAFAYIDDGSPNGIKLGSVKDVYSALPADPISAQGILNGSLDSATNATYGNLTNQVIQSCTYSVSTDLCPMVCRELPYPSSIPVCNNMTQDSNGLTTPQECAKMPDKCWLRRFASPTNDTTSLAMCPDVCKVIPPLKGNCDTNNCLLSRPDCRVYTFANNSFIWQPAPLKNAGSDQYNRCMDAQDCTPSNNAVDSCAYVVPSTGSCSVLCGGCPEVCRVETDNQSALPSICQDPKVMEQCQSCTPGCMVNATYLAQVSPDGCSSSGSSCPAEKRILTYSDPMPSDYTTGACDITSACPAQNRTPIPRNACEQCLFSEESQMYQPPIQQGCTDLCSPSNEVPSTDPSQFSAIGAEGLVGRQEIQNVAKLMLPGYVLPLFNILATLVFIIGLSTVLGGDIEIPGISKVF